MSKWRGSWWQNNPHFLPLDSICSALHHPVPLPGKWIFLSTLQGGTREATGSGTALKRAPQNCNGDKYFTRTFKKIKMTAKKKIHHIQNIKILNEDQVSSTDVSLCLRLQDWYCLYLKFWCSVHCGFFWHLFWFLTKFGITLSSLWIAEHPGCPSNSAHEASALDQGLRVFHVSFCSCQWPPCGSHQWPPCTQKVAWSRWADTGYTSFSLGESILWRGRLRPWDLMLPRCAVLSDSLIEGPQSAVAPLPHLTDFLWLQLLCAFPQFSIRLWNKSPVGSWPRDKSKSPKSYYFRIRPSFRWWGFWTRSVSARLGAHSFGMSSLSGFTAELQENRYPAGFAPCAWGRLITHIIVITIGPHLLAAMCIRLCVILTITLSRGPMIICVLPVRKLIARVVNYPAPSCS